MLTGLMGTNRSSRAAAFYSRSLRAAALLALALMMTSCALFEEQEEAPPPEPEPVPEPAPAPEPPPPSGDVDDALGMIEAGRYEKARDLLEWLMEQGRGDATVRFLLRQLVVPPEQQLPGPYRELELPAGDSLAQVAARELGNPMLFVVLARLNEIEVPRNVPVGTVLRLPEPEPEPEAAEVADAEPTPAPAETTADDLLTVADYLRASGQPDQALALLRHALLESEPPPGLQEQVVERSLERVEALVDQGEFEQAEATLKAAREVVSAPGPASSLQRALATTEARALMQQARGQREQGDLKRAHDLARRARERARSLEAAEALYLDIREQYRRETHERALLAWRERDVDLAIRSWQELLNRVPEFNAARIYLKRAEELRRRLDR